MDVEISGIPEPEIKWSKDDVAITNNHPRYRVSKEGNCYKLVIDKSK